jgi:hypothetical protein
VGAEVVAAVGIATTARMVTTVVAAAVVVDAVGVVAEAAGAADGDVLTDRKPTAKIAKSMSRTRTARRWP